MRAAAVREAKPVIVPDTKDWTWVVDRACPECGFDGSRVDARSVHAMLRENAAAWQRVLADAQDVRVRPSQDRWSTLEYACHVRDVCVLFHERLQLMLTQDGPRYGNWDQDVTAVEDRYAEQDPQQVAVELQAFAERLATAFEQVSGSQWERTGFRSDGARFTVDSFARYFLHDVVHHIHDVSGARFA